MSIIDGHISHLTTVSNVLRFLHSRFGHLALLPSHRKIRGFFNFKLGLEFLWGLLDVMSRILGSGAKRGANERQTELGNTLRSLDLKMAAAKKRKGRNPKNYRTVK